MRLFELRTINALPDGNDTANRNQSIFNKVKDTSSVIAKSGNYTIYEDDSESSIKRWFIVDHENMVGLFKFQHNTLIDKKYWVASYVWLDASQRGRGLAKAMYEMFIKKYGAVVSDFEQTEDSKRIWKSLFGKYNCYGLYWNENEEQEWGKIDSIDELEKAWPPVEKYIRLMLSSKTINTKE